MISNNYNLNNSIQKNFNNFDKISDISEKIGILYLCLHNVVSHSEEKNIFSLVGLIEHKFSTLIDESGNQHDLRRKAGKDYDIFLRNLFTVKKKIDDDFSDFLKRRNYHDRLDVDGMQIAYMDFMSTYKNLF